MDEQQYETGRQRWRRTGRTTEMFERAVRLARAGHKVLVVMHSQQFASAIHRFTVAHRDLVKSGVVRVSSIRARPESFAGAGIESVLLDHACWEQHPYETAEFLVAVRGHVGAEEGGGERERGTL